MIEHNLFTAVKITDLTVTAGSAAGTSALTTTGVDMSGYDGVMFITKFGSAAANQVMKAVMGASSGSAALTSDIKANVMTGPGSTSGSGADAWSKSYAATSTATTAGSEPLAVVDVWRPSSQYVGVVVTPGTSSTVPFILALRYRADAQPVINNDGSTVLGIVAAATTA